MPSFTCCLPLKMFGSQMGNPISLDVGGDGAKRVPGLSQELLTRVEEFGRHGTLAYRGCSEQAGCARSGVSFFVIVDPTFIGQQQY